MPFIQSIDRWLRERTRELSTTGIIQDNGPKPTKADFLMGTVVQGTAKSMAMDVRATVIVMDLYHLLHTTGIGRTDRHISKNLKGPDIIYLLIC